MCLYKGKRHCSVKFLLVFTHIRCAFIRINAHVATTRTTVVDCGGGRVVSVVYEYIDQCMLHLNHVIVVARRANLQRL